MVLTGPYQREIFYDSVTLALWEHLGWCQAWNPGPYQSASMDAKTPRTSVLNQLICRSCFIHMKLNPTSHVCAKTTFYQYHHALSLPF